MGEHLCMVFLIWFIGVLCGITIGAIVTWKEENTREKAIADVLEIIDNHIHYYERTPLACEMFEELKRQVMEGEETE